MRWGRHRKGFKMAICQKCLKKYEDRETQKAPMEELTHIFLKSVKMQLKSGHGYIPKKVKDTIRKQLNQK